MEKVVRAWINASLSLRGETAEDIADMPNIRMAKPMRMPPTCCLDTLLENIYRTIPTTATNPVSVEVDRNCTHPAPPLREDSARTQPVILVPRMAPRMIPMACLTFIIPEFTKPTTMTDVAEDDWIIAVTPVPSRNPLNGLLVSV